MLFSHDLVEITQTFSASPSAMFALLPYKTNSSTFYVEVLLFRSYIINISLTFPSMPTPASAAWIILTSFPPSPKKIKV